MSVTFGVAAEVDAPESLVEGDLSELPALRSELRKVD
jgi:hypothetical protein